MTPIVLGLPASRGFASVYGAVQDYIRDEQHDLMWADYMERKE